MNFTEAFNLYILGQVVVGLFRFEEGEGDVSFGTEFENGYKIVYHGSTGVSGEYVTRMILDTDNGEVAFENMLHYE